MKKKIKQPNVILGYDDKGNLITAYWQRDPIQIRKVMGFTIPRWKWWNPIFRFNQWRLSRKTMTFKEWETFFDQH